MLIEMAGLGLGHEAAIEKSVPRQRARRAERPWTERRGRRAGDEQFVLIGWTQVCATGDGGERCAEPGEVRWCRAVQAFVRYQSEFERDKVVCLLRALWNL